MRGRKPVPAEVRRKNGNPGKREIGDPVLVGQRLTVAGTDAELAAGDVPAGAVVIGETVYLRDALPQLPHHLALDDELNDTTDAADLWYEIAALLADANIATSGDVLVLETLVESILVARDAYAEFRTTGAIVDTLNPTNNRASSKANPSFGVWLKARAAVLKVAEQYGLTPVARARLGLAIGKGRKLAQELDDGLPPNPRDLRRGDVDGDATEIPIEE